MDIQVPKDLDVALVLLTPNFDSALSLYLLCEKISKEKLKTKIYAGICVSAAAESLSLNAVRNFAYQISASFPHIIDDHIRSIRYYTLNEDDINQVINAQTEACKEWATTLANEFDPSTNIVLYAIDALPLSEDHLSVMEEMYIKDLSKIKLLKDRTKLSSVSYESRSLPVIRPLNETGTTRKEVYDLLKDKNLMGLYDQTLSCNLSKKHEPIHNYNQPCGKCYGCLEREYIESL